MHSLPTALMIRLTISPGYLPPAPTMKSGTAVKHLITSIVHSNEGQMIGNSGILALRYSQKIEISTAQSNGKMPASIAERFLKNKDVIVKSGLLSINSIVRIGTSQKAPLLNWLLQRRSQENNFSKVSRVGDTKFAPTLNPHLVPNSICQKAVYQSFMTASWFNC